MSPSSPSQAGHTQRNALTIPQFEPLPPTSLINRIINKLLAPLFYLLFTIITAIVVVPIYTIIENFKQGRNSKGGARFHSDRDLDQKDGGGNATGRPSGRSEAQDFLKGFSSSYVGVDARGETKAKAQKTHQHHQHHQHQTPAELQAQH